MSCIAVSAVLTWMMIRLAPKWGLVDVPSDRRIHEKVIPRAGGIAVWLTLVLGFLALKLIGLDSGSGLSPHWMDGFLIASSVLVAVGILDDRRGVPAKWKLAGQIVAATLFFFLSGKPAGQILGFSIHWSLDLVVTVAWTVLLINAFNLIDGMDGLCAGLGLISCLCMAALALSFGKSSDVLVILVMAAALGGFLIFNFHPARIFLGDTGSMLVGFFIASAAAGSVGERAAIVSLLLPLLVAGVPLFDVLFAVWRRTARSRADSLRDDSRFSGLFDPDKDHLHHRLLASGFCQRKAVAILYGVALLFALIVCAPFFFDQRALGLSVTLLGVLALIGFRYVAPVELRISGDLLHLALKKPGNARLVAGAYFFYDFLVLVGVMILAAYIEGSALVGIEALVSNWPIGLVILVCALISLKLAKAHSRYWSRATLRDVVSLLVWFSLGLTLAFTVSTFLSKDLAWSSFRTFVMIAVFGGILLLVPRLLTAVLRELIVDSQHRSLFRSKGKRDRVVVYGAGDLGELFLHHLKVTEPTQLADRRIIGFVDDNPNLARKSMDGFKIFGGAEKLGELVEKYSIKGVVVCATRMAPEKAEFLNKTACDLGLKVFRWRPQLQLTEVPATLANHYDGPLSATETTTTTINNNHSIA